MTKVDSHQIYHWNYGKTLRKLSHIQLTDASFTLTENMLKKEKSPISFSRGIPGGGFEIREIRSKEN